MEECNGKLTKVVHINRLQHRCVPDQQDVSVSNDCNSHSPERFPPWVDHVILPTPEQTLPNRYPQTTGLELTLSLWSSFN